LNHKNNFHENENWSDGLVNLLDLMTRMIEFTGFNESGS